MRPACTAYPVGRKPAAGGISDAPVTNTTTRLIAAPLAGLVLLAPLAGCSSGPEEQVCAVLEADGDDYVPIRDPAICPPPGAPAAAQGPLWVPVSWLDDDDHRTYRTARPSTVTVRPSPPPRSTATTAPKTTRSAPRTTTSRSR